MSAALRMALVVALGAVGCDVPFEGAASRIDNRCETSSDCGANGVCVALGASRACVATDIDLPSVVFEVRPSARPTVAPDTSYLFASGDAADLGLGALAVPLVGHDDAGIVGAWSPELPALVSIAKGAVVAGGAALDPACLISGGLVAAQIEFVRVAALQGFAPAHYASSTGADGHFGATIPPDTYAIYVVPEAVPGCARLPPALFPPTTITSDVGLTITLPAPKLLSGDVRLPKGANLSGWSVDLFEPMAGRVISTEGDLSAFPLGNGATFALRYSWAPKQAPIVRLRPKPGTFGPTFFWDLAAADLDGDAKVSLGLSDVDAKPKSIQAKVVDEDGAPISASVTFESLALSGLGNSAFKTMLETDAAGSFAANLFPGTYRVLARPTVDPDRALAVDSWDIRPTDLCCGRSIMLSRKTRLQGSVRTPRGEPMFDASVVATPSFSQPPSYFSGVLQPEPILPREAATFPEASGEFSLGVDRGEFDVSIRPRGGSLFSWLVRSRIAVAESAYPIDLGAFTTSYPAILTGTVLDPSGMPLSDATLRAWLPVKAAANADAVIEIASTKTRDDGTYVIALPASIAK